MPQKASASWTGMWVGNVSWPMRHYQEIGRGDGSSNDGNGGSGGGGGSGGRARGGGSNGGGGGGGAVVRQW